MPWVLVPVKDTLQAKQRLAAVLTPRQRQILALGMAEDVLSALLSMRGLAGIAVVTLDPFAARLARRLGVQVIDETPQSGHTGAVAAGTRALMDEHGASAVMTLPIDVPLVTGKEIERVIAAHDWTSPAFTIVPAHDRQGSNCILRSPPESIPLRFGEDSFYRHLASVRRAGIRPTVVSAFGIGLDVDHPEDIEAFLQVEGSTRTRRLLIEFGVAERLTQLAARAQDHST